MSIGGKAKWYLVCGGLTFMSGPLCAEDLFSDEDGVIKELGDNYGVRAAMRARTSLNFIRTSSKLDTMDKLVAINYFFNTFEHIDDKSLWGEDNYWATPLEFIGVNGGDCEDFAIAKYFTLMSIGVAEYKLRLFTVKSLSSDEYHMVLAYYETPESTPLILDNIDYQIKPLNLRTDLLPLFSFNGQYIWLSNEQKPVHHVGTSYGVGKWNDLRSRIGVSELNQPRFVLD